MPGRHASASAPFRGRPIGRAVYGTGRVNRRGGIILSILAYSRSAGAGACHHVAADSDLRREIRAAFPTGTF
jgi:hypothetical protein